VGEQQFGATDFALVNGLFDLLGTAKIFFKSFKFKIDIRHVVLLFFYPFRRKKHEILRELRVGNFNRFVLQESYMENVFKQKLLSLRHPAAAKSFGEAILGTELLWGQPRATVAVKPAAAESFNEKSHVLNSLEQFAQEKLLASGEKSLALEGGQLLLREDGWSEIKRVQDLPHLKAQLQLDPRPQELILADKHPGKLAILFVTEHFRPWSEVAPELRGSFLDQLLCSLPLKTAELFERMIVAMKLAPTEVCIYPVEQGEQDLALEVMTVAAYLRPELIVTLGARATQKILKTPERLSMIHGQFFQREVGEHGVFNIVPLFHPSIIETNQNMKKTAWTDMQKIMRHLKKLQ
jgi:uracil-DNA glycosylase family 4